MPVNGVSNGTNINTTGVTQKNQNSNSAKNATASTSIPKGSSVNQANPKASVNTTASTNVASTKTQKPMNSDTLSISKEAENASKNLANINKVNDNKITK
jgi:hypothetical protein